MRILVVVPTYNEAANVEALVREVHAALPDAGILVVDDGSPDGTADLAEKVAVEIAEIHVLRRSGKSGLGSAYRAGFRWGLAAGYDACVEMDA
ncbi:MAG: glycosyltransferase, partial [Acidimicrobiales bacterium]